MAVRFVGGPFDGIVSETWDQGSDWTPGTEVTDPKFQGVYLMTAEREVRSDGTFVRYLHWQRPAPQGS